MTEKEQLLKEITDNVKNELKGYATVEDINKALENAKAELGEKFSTKEIAAKLAEIEKAAREQGEFLAKMKNQEPVKALTIKEQLKGQEESIKRIMSGDMTAKATVLPTSVATNNVGQEVAGIGQIQTRNNLISALFAQAGIAPNNQRTLRYTQQTTRTSAADARVIGAKAAESTLVWEKKTIDIESYSHIIPVALEMLDDYDFVQNEINQFLLNDLMLKVEADAFNGNGTSPIIKGVYTSATAWVDPEIDFKEATMIELIQTCITQISNNSKFKANYVLMNNYDALTLKLVKNDLGMYLFPNFMGADGMNIEGVRIIATPLVTKNTLLVGDFTQGTMYSRPASIQVGLNGTDFAERQVSILANVDVALLIKSVQESAFVKVTDVADAISKITKGA